MRVIYLLFFFSLCFVFNCQAIHFFEGDYTSALKKAKTENKNLFICFSASWCGPCKMMEKYVFPNEKVAQYVDTHFIPLHLDIDIQENAALQKRINPEYAGVVPHLCILSPEETLIKESGGALSIPQMLKFLQITPKNALHRKIAKSSDIDSIQQLFAYKDSYQQILEKAQRENKNMLLCFSSHYCGPCRLMKKTTFSSPFIVDYAQEHYVPGYLDLDKEENIKLCVRYLNKDRIVPYLVIASPDEKIINKHTGYMDSTAFMAFLRTDSLPSRTDILPQDEVRVEYVQSTPTWWNKFIYSQQTGHWKLELLTGINVTTLKTSGNLSALDFNHRIGYEAGIAFNRSWQHFRLAPGLSFISKGGKNKDYTLRQNYLEVPVKIGWIFHNPGYGWYQCLDVTPYGSLRVGHKLKRSDTAIPKAFFETDKFDYGLRFALHARFSSGKIEGGYNLGLHNISSVPGGGMYHRGFFLNLMLSLGG